jgi:RHS repeat-associated protein
MPMTECFYTMNGQMMAYDSGGVTKDFLTDHLGSITAEIDQTQTRTYDTRYSAYGRNIWSTGSNCGFGWVGSYGYRETGLFKISHYVRARHYSAVAGSWTTVDPLWPNESAYGYADAWATRMIDPAGRNRVGLICLLVGPPSGGCDCNEIRRLHDVPDGAGFLGCNKGKLFPCPNKTYSVGQVSPPVHGCSTVHEEQHKKWCERNPGKCDCTDGAGFSVTCGISGSPRGGPGGDEDECEAHVAHIDCFSKIKPFVCDKPKSSDCKYAKIKCEVLFGLRNYDGPPLKCKLPPGLKTWCDKVLAAGKIK